MRGVVFKVGAFSRHGCNYHQGVDALKHLGLASYQ